jgi:hypothetical protein
MRREYVEALAVDEEDDETDDDGDEDEYLTGDETN